MALKERIPTMMQFPCSCGEDAVEIVGTVTHYVGGKEIRIHNIPHYECPNCKQVEYSIKKVKVTPILRHAMVHDLSDIDYIDFQNGLREPVRA